LLGQHHDLAVLSERIAANRRKIKKVCDIDQLLIYLSERQDVLEERALKLGQSLFPKEATSAEELFLKYGTTRKRKSG